MLRVPDLSFLAKPPPLKVGVDMPDRYRITLATMITEPWLLFGAWAAGGLVLALLGFWQIALITSGIGTLVDMGFQRHLRRLWTAEPIDPRVGVRGLVPIVASRFSLGVAGSIAAVVTTHSPAIMAVVMMLQAWSICVAMAQFNAVPRLFVTAISPPLFAVVVSMWPYVLTPAGPALAGSMALLVAILVVIGRQAGEVWRAWSESCAENAKLIADLQAARMAADAASQAKSTFLATMSHEVRTPLNGILGMTQLMAMNPLDKMQRERVEVIRRSGETLLGTLNAVLDLSRIEAGRLELTDGIVHPAQIASDSVSTFAASAGLKGLSLTSSAGPEVAGAFRGDPVRLRQVVDNLVGNAIKFTYDGGVHVSVAVLGGQLVFEVRDTGPGIAAEDLARVFRPFEQADGSHRRAHEGSGLGLAICLQLAELMKGRLEAESDVGHGSVFRLVVPAEVAEMTDDATAQPVADTLDSFSVLVAEDNATNRTVIRSLLEHLGARPHMVENGQEAIDALRMRPFQVILMDVQMPVLDGLAATRAIRRGEGGMVGTHVPIIGLTGNAMDHQVAECLAAGMTSVVPKPIQLPILVRAINAAMVDIETEPRRAGSGF